MKRIRLGEDDKDYRKDIAWAAIDSRKDFNLRIIHKDIIDDVTFYVIDYGWQNGERGGYYYQELIWEGDFKDDEYYLDKSLSGNKINMTITNREVIKNGFCLNKHNYFNKQTGEYLGFTIHISPMCTGSNYSVCGNYINEVIEINKII